MTTLVLPDIPTSMSDAEGEKLAELAEGHTVLELGAWQGYSTVCIAQTAKVTHSVDWHHGDQHAGEGSTLVAYLQNLQKYGLLTHVNVHIGRFEQMLPALADSHFDLVFVDGQHDYESVTEDIGWALRLVRDGGVLAFHDYGITAASGGGPLFGVTRAVDERWPVTEVVDTLAVVRLGARVNWPVGWAD